MRAGLFFFRCAQVTGDAIPSVTPTQGDNQGNAMMNIRQALEMLANERPVLHSEADLQHALAWKLHEQEPHPKIRLEYPRANDSRWHIDIWTRSQEETVAVELKYKTKKHHRTVEGEQFDLRSQSAQNFGRYDFLKDVWRLEQVVGEGEHRADVGYAILLTNDPLYWNKPRKRKPNDASFRLHDNEGGGREVPDLDTARDGSLEWQDATRIPQIRKDPIVLNNKYELHWSKYGEPIPEANAKFRYLLVEVQSH